LIESFHKVLNRICDVFKLIFNYLSLMIGTVETNLFGWKEGHAKKVINDALNYVFNVFKDLFKWYHQLI
jgi:hypothetical protein